MRLRAIFYAVSIIGIILFAWASWIFIENYYRIEKVSNYQNISHELSYKSDHFIHLTHDLVQHNNERFRLQWLSLYNQLIQKILNGKEDLTLFFNEIELLEYHLHALKDLVDDYLQIKADHNSARLSDQLWTSSLSIRIAELQAAIDELNKAVNLFSENQIGASGKSLLINLSATFLAFLVFGVLVAFVFYQRVLKPLTLLISSITTIREKDASHRPQKMADDEIGSVVDALNSMLNKEQQVSQNLKFAKERIEAAASAGIVGIWEWNPEKDELLWDKVMYQLYRIKPEDFAGAYKAWSSVLHPDDKEYTESEIQAALRGEREYEPEFRIICPNGEVRYIKAASHTSFDEAGKPVRMIGINYDLTDQKQIEKALKVKTQQLAKLNHGLEKEVARRTKELEKAKNEAERANREKSRFLANMSHELRTPMHAILSFADLALKKSGDEKINHYLENIRTSGLRLTSLLDDLLDLSKLEVGKMLADFSMQDIAALIQQAITEVGSLLSDKNITIKFTTEKPVECMFDQNLMMQVFVNLFSNAIKFSPHGSDIEVDVETVRKQTGDKMHDVVILSITDQGIGIPADEIDAIFDKFVQSTKTMTHSGGTGLGLAITQEIIKLHQGSIWAESPPKGKKTGSSFHIQIPVMQ